MATTEIQEKDPFQQFQLWFDEAVNSGVPDPNSMTLATATPDGKPSARIVLLKGVADGGLQFFTNYQSRKARELDENPLATIVFHWATMLRQVRVEGTIRKISEQQSDDYWKTRPRESQIGGWASSQSEKIESYDALRERFQQIEKKYAGQDIPRPPHWGGFELIPQSFEFWLGKIGRLHLRVFYRREKDGSWKREILCP